MDPATALWPRLIQALPESAELPARRAGVRRLGPGDAAALARLDPSIAWISETWDGPAGLATSGRAWAAFDGDALVSVACASAVAADIRARGHRPTWATSPDNLASRAVAGRLGFAHVRDDVLYAVRTPIPE